jgi:GAF domain-containing protein
VSDSEQTRTPDAPERVDEVTRALSDLSELLAAEEELVRVLQRGVDQATRAIPSADLVSVTVVRDDGAETVAANSERACTIDSQQYATGEGPCLDAARSGETVRASAERAMRLWPRFARIARPAGVASYLSSPLIIADKFAGSLNLYSSQPHGFGDLDEALLRLYTTAAAAAIANARRYAEARALAENLGRALQSRAVIDQAIGVLIAVQGISPEEAFSDMSRQSQNTNTKLRDIAARIVEQVRRRSK